jgi:sterol desaturase/sphingolipid hydroxylase (fatty acid hydroxylase superfamily)
MIDASFFHSYGFWLALASLVFLGAERLAPWRAEQRLLRPQLPQDIFWLLFNGYALGMVFGPAFRLASSTTNSAFSRFTGMAPGSIKLLGSLPLWSQVILFLALADLLEWCVHNLLHRNRWLWKIHRVHHSITVMDWIGNFRFHWGEVLVYKMLKYLPLAVLGVRYEAMLITAVVSTTVGHGNHANLNISWGPLRYLLNSPRMHIWHHDRELHGPAGVNFAVVFSAWDWLFGTAYMPRDRLQPDAIGFEGLELLPSSLPVRFFAPMWDPPRRRQTA